jgi:hypothetical protein
MIQVKETITGKEHKSPSNHENDDLKYANIDPMGGQPNREPLSKPAEPPLNKKTEDLQKKGARHKAEEDSFNLL